MKYNAVCLMGFKEYPYRSWDKTANFVTHLFANKWLDLFQIEGQNLIYKSTLTLKP